MDWKYLRRVLSVFLTAFFIIHLFMQGMMFEKQIQYSMLATGIFVVYHTVSVLSGGKNAEND